MSSTIRAKFRCVARNESENGYVEYRFTAVMGKYVTDPVTKQTIPDPEHENSKLWKASPNGDFRICIDKNFTSAAWEIGREYYLDTSPAPLS